jgi:hypothetical protein
MNQDLIKRDFAKAESLAMQSTALPNHRKVNSKFVRDLLIIANRKYTFFTFPILSRRRTTKWVISQALFSEVIAFFQNNSISFCIQNFHYLS